MIKVLLALLFCLSIVYTQQEFDHPITFGGDISLTSSGQDFIGTVVDQSIVGEDCDEVIHRITNMQTNGPINSGTYFSLEISNRNNTNLAFRLFTTVEPIETSDYLPIVLGLEDGVDFTESVDLASTENSYTGVCGGNDVCELRYFCDIYEENVNYYVGIYVEGGSNIVSNVYDLQFTQFIEPISVIGSTRTLTQSQIVSDPYDSLEDYSARNFIQYYHDLETTVQERGSFNVLWVDVDGFNDVTGTAFVCVSYDGMPGTRLDLNSQTFQDDDDGTPFSQLGCSMDCAEGVITNGAGRVRLPIPVCNINTCFNEGPMWIGVRPIEGSTYTITLSFRPESLPPITQLQSGSLIDDVVEFDDDNCEPELGRYTCENYYQLGNGGASQPQVAGLGPILIAEMYGVRNGEAELELTDGYLGGDSNCGCGIEDSCQSVDPFYTNANQNCKIVVPSCQWNDDLSNDWIFTISGTSQENDDNYGEEEYIKYAFDVRVVEYTLDTISSNGITQGQVAIDEYNHYVISFTEEMVTRDAVFSFEIFPNFSNEDLEVYWNRGSLAGSPSDCYDYEGLCGTSGDYQYNDYWTAGSCRFSFYDCDYDVSFFDYHYIQYGYVNKIGYYYTDDDWKLKNSRLMAGDYYFAVKGINQFYDYFYIDNPRAVIDYTIRTSLQYSLPVVESVTSLHTVFRFDYTRQYYYDIPEDTLIIGSVVRIDDVQNGIIQAFSRCGDFAGDCPCYDFDKTCFASDASLSQVGNYFYQTLNDYYVYSDGSELSGLAGHDCDLIINSCDCSVGSRVYVSVLGIESYNPYTEAGSDNTDRMPIGFAMVVNFIYQDVDSDDIPTITVGTETEPSVNTGVLYTAEGLYQDYSSDEYSFYELDFSDYQGDNTLPADSTLELTLKFYGLIEEENAVPANNNNDDDNINDDHSLDDDDINFLDYYTTSHPVARMWVNFNSIAGDPSTYFCDSIAECTVYSGEYDDDQEDSGYSYCTIVFEPCRYNTDVSCYDTRDLSETILNGGFDDLSEERVLKDERAYFNSNSMNLNRWYVSVQNLGYGSTFGNYFGESIQFTLQTAVVQRPVIALADAVTTLGRVSENSYRHFSYSKDSSSSNVVSWLWAELWDNPDQLGNLAFYMNFVDSQQGFNIRAGDISDCYYHFIPCDVCHTEENSHYCRYEVEPCVHDQLTGTYYFSVKSVDHIFFDNDLDFNIRITENQAQDISDGIPVTQTLYEDQTFYYVFDLDNAPNPNNLANSERYFSIELDEVVSGNIFVNIGRLSPNSNCFCEDNSVQIDGDFRNYYIQDDDFNPELRFIRFPCNFDSTTNDLSPYYISVGVEHRIPADYSNYVYSPYESFINTSPTSFIIHTEAWDIQSTPLTLFTNNTSTNNIRQTYDNEVTENPAIPGFRINRNEVHHYDFTVDVQPLSVANVQITLNTTNIATTAIEFFLNNDEPYLPSGSNDFGGDLVGEVLDESNCVFAFDSCTLFDDGDVCNFYIDACTLSQSNNWFITAIGQNIPLHTLSSEFDIQINVIDPQTIINPPVDFTVTTTNNLSTDITDIDSSFGNQYYILDGTMGLTAGQAFEISASNFGGSAVLQFSDNDNSGFCSTTCSDSGSNPSCRVYACSNVNAESWFFYISASQTTSNGQISIQIIDTPCATCTTSSTNLNNNQDNGLFPALATGEWAYFTTNVPAGTDSYYEMITSNNINLQNDIFMVDGNTGVILPGIETGLYGFDSNTDVVLFGSSSSSCGTTQYTSSVYEGTCCYEQRSDTFAVVGSINSDFSINIDIVDFVVNNAISINNPSSGSQNSFTATNHTVQWVTVNYDPEDSLFLNFNVTSGSAEVFMNYGSVAGSLNPNFKIADGGDFGHCYPNDGVFHNSICSNTLSTSVECTAQIPPCEACSGNNGGLVTFGFIPEDDEDLVVNYFFQTIPVVSLTGSASNLNFPVSQNVANFDTSISNGQYDTYTHYVITSDQYYPTDKRSYFPLDDGKDTPFVTFTLSDPTSVNPTSGTSFPVDVFINTNSLAGPNVAGCFANNNNICDVELINNSTLWSCSISLCSQGCGTDYYISVGRSTSDDNQFTFDFNQDISLDPIDDVLTVTNSIQSSTIITDTLSTQTVYYFVIDLQDFIWTELRIYLSNVQTNSNSQFTIDYFSTPLENLNGDLCTNTGSNNLFECITNADELDDDDLVDDDNNDCQLTLDPCSFASFQSTSSNNFVYVRVEDSQTQARNFTLNAEPIFPEVTSINVDLQSFDDSYYAVKEIVSEQTHYFTFNLPNSDGYHGVQFIIDDVSCIDDDEGRLTINSFFDDDSDFVYFNDGVPTNSCTFDNYYIEDDDNSTGLFMSTCHYAGTQYQLSVGLNKRGGVFNTLTEYPVIYSIDVEFITLGEPILMVPEMKYTENVSDYDFIQYFEVHVEAENRGSEISFYINFEDLDDDYSLPGTGPYVGLLVSRNSIPFDPDFDCAWDVEYSYYDDDVFTNFVYDYNCFIADDDDNNNGHSCVIDIPPCEFRNTIYYVAVISVPGLGDHDLTFGTYIDSKYTPVYDLVSSPQFSTQGVIGDNLYQYYKVTFDKDIPNFLLQLTLSSQACENTNSNYQFDFNYDCYFDMYIATQELGFASHNRLFVNTDDDDYSTNYSSYPFSAGPDCDRADGTDCNCFDIGCSFSTETDSCSSFISECNVGERNAVFVGITSYVAYDDVFIPEDDDTSGKQCVYNLAVDSQVSINNVEIGSNYCDAIYCDHFYTPTVDNAFIDLTGETLEVTVNNLKSDDEIIFAISSGSIPYLDNNNFCFDYESVSGVICPGRTVCDFKYTCNSEQPYVLVKRSDFACNSACDSFEVSVNFEFVDTDYSFTTISSNSPIQLDTLTCDSVDDDCTFVLEYQHTAGALDYIFGDLVSSVEYSVNNVVDIFDDDDQFANDDEDNRLYCGLFQCGDHDDDDTSDRLLVDYESDNTYYFYFPSGSFSSGDIFEIRSGVSAASTFTSSTTSTHTFTSNAGPQMFHFTVDTSNDFDSFDVHVDVIKSCNSESNIDDLNLYLTSTHNGFPFDGCDSCTNGDQLISGACPSSSQTFSYDTTEFCGDLYYFTLSSCFSFVCDVDIQVTVEYSTLQRTLLTDRVFVSQEKDCGFQFTDYYYFDTTEDNFLVTISEVFGVHDIAVTGWRECGDDDDDNQFYFNTSGVTDVLSYYYNYYDDDISTSSGNDDDDDTSTRFYCASPGRYYLNVDYTISDISFNNNNNIFQNQAQYAIQLRTGYQTLSGSVTNNIFGEDTQFYTFPNNGQSVNLRLSILSGTSLRMTLHDGCNWGTDAYSDSVICGHGECYITLPSRASVPNSENFYVLIDSGDIPELNEQNENDQSVYIDTSYVLNLSTGSANCGSLPGSFCSSTSQLNLGSSSWNFNVDASLKEQEAMARYNDLIDRCPTPNDNCAELLRHLSCLETYPNCDANGFQLGICSDLCIQIEEACGTIIPRSRDQFNFYTDFVQNYNRGASPRFEYSCFSDRYVSDIQDSSCVILPSASPSTSLSPSPSFSPAPTPSNLPVIDYSYDDDDKTTIEVELIFTDSVDESSIDDDEETTNTRIVIEVSDTTSFAPTFTFSVSTIFISLTALLFTHFFLM